MKLLGIAGLVLMFGIIFGAITGNIVLLIVSSLVYAIIGLLGICFVLTLNHGYPGHSTLVVPVLWPLFALTQ
jgi:hypothetical protein